VFAFDRFTLHPVQRRLLDDGEPVPIGSRALDILVALASRAGEVVGKSELIAQAWPGITVEENNLRVHIAALRKSLGDGKSGNRFIANVPGRGYSFVAPVTVREANQLEALPATPRVPLAGNLPVPLLHVHGRAEVIRELAAQLPQRRLATITGAGGIGKTTVAIAAAKTLSRAYTGGTIFVDLAPIADPRLVPSAVVAALGMAPRAEGLEGALSAFLRDRSILLVLDSCEHVVEAAATLAEALLRASPGLGILSTSREPLRAEGEWVLRLAPLGLPPAVPALGAAEALRSPAVQLFVERAAASLGSYDLTDADAPLVAEICRRLDGIALAIEFAAGRLEAFGLRQLAMLIDDRFQLLTRGRRTALPRHQTLRATLDWSYGLLPEPERVVLRRLAVFRGGFGLAASRDVAAAGMEAPDIGEALASLVDKSLLTVELSDAEPHYRLFETTRAYALEMLAAFGELTSVQRNHAEHYRRLLERAAVELDLYSAPVWLAAYARHIDDLRAALHWAFSEGGDSVVGVALTIGGIPIWSQLALANEGLGWVSKALAALDPADPAHRRFRMQLYAAAGWLNQFVAYHGELSAAASREALRLAEELGDADYQSRAIWMLWADRMNQADCREGLRLAERFRVLPVSDATQPLIGERMIGAALHMLGDQAAARESLEAVLKRYPAMQPPSHVTRFHFHQRTNARMVLTRVLWLQGFPDSALQEVAANIDEASSLDHPMSLCNALAQSACPLALLTGDMTTAAHYLAMLRAASSANAIDVWRIYANGFEGELLLRQRQTEAGLRQLADAAEALRRAAFTQHLTYFLAVQADGLAQAGRDNESLAIVDNVLTRCAASGEVWALAELKRIRANALCASGASADEAEAELHEALAIARAQGALSWELRAGISLAEFWGRLGRHAEAREILAPIVERFTQGFGTADLERAGKLLAASE
jgi:predicted ATPase/DNA-binding winged helix-turn-helix (wHTH) protein